MIDSPSKPASSAPAIVGAALASVAALFLMIYTEQYDPGGSPWAPWFVVLLVSAHLPLAWRRPEARWMPTSVGLPSRAVVLVCGALIVAAVGVYTYMGQASIFSEPVRGRGSAQLGMVTQVVSRIETDRPLYSKPYERDGFEERNGFPLGLVVPYAAARAQGLDWRYASVVSVLFLGALLVAGVIVTSRAREDAGARDGALVAIALCGAGWLLLPQLWPYINWGHTIPLWPVIAWLGLTIAARWHGMTALLAGVLAAMNPGWVLMLPVIAVYIWREEKRFFPAMAACMILPPLVAYGANREYFYDMLRGILGNTFLAGDDHDKLNAWRYTTLHGVGDFLNMRWGIYLLGLTALGMICFQIARRETARERIHLIALAAFVVIICGPQAYAFHWAAHCVFVAALIPAAILANDPVYISERKRIFIGAPLVAGGATAAACAVLLYIQYRSGFSGTLTAKGIVKQPPTERLLSGFNIPSADHAWGESTTVEVGFTMDRVNGGMLELELGTLGGDFTPYNPVYIRINGHEKGLFRALPGETRFVQIPVRPGDIHVGYNVLELEAAWSRTPRSVNLADDHRTVSVRYGGLAYIPPLAMEAD